MFLVLCLSWNIGLPCISLIISFWSLELYRFIHIACIFSSIWIIIFSLGSSLNFAFQGTFIVLNLVVYFVCLTKVGAFLLVLWDSLCANGKLCTGLLSLRSMVTFVSVEWWYSWQYKAWNKVNVKIFLGLPGCQTPFKLASVWDLKQKYLTFEGHCNVRMVSRLEVNVVMHPFGCNMHKLCSFG